MDSWTAIDTEAVAGSVRVVDTVKMFDIARKFDTVTVAGTVQTVHKEKALDGAEYRGTDLNHTDVPLAGTAAVMRL